LRIELPIKIRSLNKSSRGWQGKYFSYTKPVRAEVGLVVKSAANRCRLPFVPPLFIRITRIGAKPLDKDNLAGGCKPVRDGVADGLGLKDDAESTGLSWVYEQRRGAPKEYGCIIEVERR